MFVLIGSIVIVLCFAVLLQRRRAARVLFHAILQPGELAQDWGDSALLVHPVVDTSCLT